MKAFQLFIQRIVVNSTLGHTTTNYYPGKHYSVEEKGGALKVQKHYAAGSTIIAVRTVTAEADTLQWMISDQLGSTSTTANADGTWNNDIRYTAFGEIRLKTGVTATGYRYTGQLDMQGSIGLDYYVAQFYDPQLARFAQADTLIPDPGKSVSFDRYAYVKNNPIIFTDPTGHKWDCTGANSNHCYMKQLDEGRCKLGGSRCFVDGRRDDSGKATSLIKQLVSKNNETSKTKLADKLSKVALGLDAISAVLSGLEAGFSNGFTIAATGIGFAGGGTVGPFTIPAGGLAGATIGLGFDGWLAMYSPLGKVENGLGIGSLILTAFADYLSTNTKLDFENGDFAIGKDTIVSARNAFMGLVPESNTDAWISFSQLKYDIDRNFFDKEGGSYNIISNWKINDTQMLGAGLHFYFFDWW